MLVLVPIDSTKNTMEVKGNQNCLVTNILQNIFCVPQKNGILNVYWGRKNACAIFKSLSCYIFIAFDLFLF